VKVFLPVERLPDRQNNPPAKNGRLSDDVFALAALSTRAKD
jgi:hypothetical protein